MDDGARDRDESVRQGSKFPESGDLERLKRAAFLARESDFIGGADWAVRGRPVSFWLGREGSNLRMTESKSVALPLGYASAIRYSDQPNKSVVAHNWRHGNVMLSNGATRAGGN